MTDYVFSQNERDQFLAEYIVAQIWANAYAPDPDNPGMGMVMADGVFEGVDLSEFLIEGARSTMRSDCNDFLDRVEEELSQADWDAYAEAVEPKGFDALVMAAHDFSLTRNGCGTGFWDRGAGEAGQRLTDMAESYGEQRIIFHQHANGKICGEVA